MKKILLNTYLLLTITTTTLGQSKKIKVYLLGTFHFAATDTTVYDVRKEKYQKSIRQLSDIIVGLNPSKIFIEKMPEWEYENHIDSLYQEYRKGNLSRARNEIWQVAGRVATRLNHAHLYQCDQPGNYSFHYGLVADYASKNQEQDKLRYLGKGMTKPILSCTNIDSIRNAVDLLEYLRWFNSAEVQNSSQAHYVNVYPQIGNTNAYTPANKIDSSYFLGANVTIDWYRRNILIYAKMLSQLDYTENSIFLIIGNDHVPIIRQMFQANPYFEVMETEKWLSRSKIKVKTN